MKAANEYRAKAFECLSPRGVHEQSQRTRRDASVCANVVIEADDFAKFGAVAPFVLHEFAPDFHFPKQQ